MMSIAVGISKAALIRASESALFILSATVVSAVTTWPVPELTPFAASVSNPGAMRVSYVLPSADWKIKSSGVFWPDAGPLHKAAEQASRHRLVWIDIRPPP